MEKNFKILCRKKMINNVNEKERARNGAILLVAF